MVFRNRQGHLRPACLRLSFNGNVVRIFLYCILLFWNGKGKNTIFEFRMDIFFLNFITYIKTTAYISGITLTTDIFSIFIFFIFIQTFCCTYSYITVFKLDLNLIFFKVLYLNTYLISKGLDRSFLLN